MGNEPQLWRVGAARCEACRKDLWLVLPDGQVSTGCPCGRGQVRHRGAVATVPAGRLRDLVPTDVELLSVSTTGPTVPQVDTAEVRVSAYGHAGSRDRPPDPADRSGSARTAAIRGPLDARRAG